MTLPGAQAPTTPRTRHDTYRVLQLLFLLLSSFLLPSAPFLLPFPSSFFLARPRFLAKLPKQITREPVHFLLLERSSKGRRFSGPIDFSFLFLLYRSSLLESFQSVAKDTAPVCNSYFFFVAGQEYFNFVYLLVWISYNTSKSNRATSVRLCDLTFNLIHHTVFNYRIIIIII